MSFDLQPSLRAEAMTSEQPNMPHAVLDSVPAIEFCHVAKTYPAAARPGRRLLELLGLRKPSAEGGHTALRDIRFSVARGESVGLIGRNGAGKSTLLQILAGTLQPSQGEVRVRGRVAALLELGAGFNPEFTGRENVFLNGALLGLRQAEIEARYPAIVDFAGLGDFIDQPVKTYSSGMYVRLAFSIATSIDPDILIVDEALSVGDGDFARKSFRRIMELKEGGATIVFCSHSMYQVEALCDRALWLEGGVIRQEGNPKEVATAYEGFLAERNAPAQISHALPNTETHATTDRIRIRSLTARTLGPAGQEFAGPDALTVASETDELELALEFTAPDAVPQPQAAFVFMTLDGNWIASVGTHISGTAPQRQADGAFRVVVRFPRIPLLKGLYTVDAYILDREAVIPLEHVMGFAKLLVTQTHLARGVVQLPHVWQAI